MLWKGFVCRPKIGPKHFEKLKPEPGPSPARLTTLLHSLLVDFPSALLRLAQVAYE